MCTRFYSNLIVKICRILHHKQQRGKKTKIVLNKILIEETSVNSFVTEHNKLTSWQKLRKSRASKQKGSRFVFKRALTIYSPGRVGRRGSRG